MSMIEFQISVPSFLAAQRAALRSRRLCPPRPVPVGQAEVIVDKIEFGNSAIRHHVSTEYAVMHSSLTSTAPGVDVDGLQTQIAQDVTVHVTTRDEIVSRPNQAPVNVVALHGTVVFNIGFYALEHDCFFWTTFADFEPGPLPTLPAAWGVIVGTLVTSVRNVLRSVIPSTTVPAGLSELTVLWAKFINAGLSVDTSLQRIALRAQIGGDHDGMVPRWRNFFNGHFSDRLGGAHWGVFIDSGLITEMVKAKANRALDAVDVDNLGLFVGCGYSTAGGKATFTLDVRAIYDLPDPLTTISRHPRLPFEISISAPNTLRLRADYSDVVGLIHSFDIVELILPSLSDAIEAFVQHEIGAALADVNAGNDAPYCTQMPVNIVECTKIVQLPRISGGTAATLTSVLALEEGIAFVGTATALSHTPSVLTTSAAKFTWNPPEVSCGQSSSTTVQQIRLNAASVSRLRAEVRLEHTGTTPVFVCAGPTVVSDDQLGIFPASAITLDRTRLPATITVTIRDPGPTYAAAPYHLDLMISTTAGTRLVRVPPPPVMTPQIADLMAGSVEVQLMICDRVLGAWFDGARKFDVAWIENPLLDPPKEITFEHLWQIEVRGLREGQIVRANTANGPLMQAVAHDGAAVRLSALVPPTTGPELTVALGNGRHASGSEQRAASPLGSPRFAPYDRSTPSLLVAGAQRYGRGIEIRQQPSMHASSIALDRPCSQLLESPLHERPGLLAVVHDEIVLFDLRDPHDPIRERSWRMDGVRGARKWKGNVLAFGENGFAAISGAGSPMQVGPSCELHQIQDVSLATNVAYVVTAEALEVRSTKFCPMSTLPFAGGRCVTRMGQWLIAGGRAGLALYDAADDRRPVVRAFRDDLDVTGFVLPLDGPNGSFVATLADGSARMFHVQSGRLEEMAVYARAPWFADSVRLDQVLIRVASDRRQLNVNVLGESRLVVPADEPSAQADALV